VTRLGPRARWSVLIGSTVALVALGLLVETRGLLPMLRFGIQRTPKLAPSTVVVPVPELTRDQPMVSLYLSPNDLNDPATGILANKMRHGRAWERQGWVSFFEHGRLTYTASAGVRVHGGGSRLTSARQGFRLLFRRAYGAKELPAGIAFHGAHAHPVRRLIIHNDVRFDRARRMQWHLANPLAYDIAAAAGGIVAATRPVRFFLNGEFQGVFVLTEHFDPDDYFKTHWRHSVRLDNNEFEGLWQQVQALRPLRMRNVGQLVDLDNLTRWFIAVAFCATGDAFQGPGQFRDPTRTTAQWFFVNFDMDLSFRDPAHDTFASILSPGGERRGRRRSEPRSRILTTLLREDPEYRELFKRTWVDVMNHRITPAFLDERFEHYARIASELGVRDLAYLSPLKRFLQARPVTARKLAEKWLNTPPSVRVHIAGTGGPMLVDGNTVASGWDGYYFPGMRVRLAIPDQNTARVSFWRVNERVVEDAALDLVADEDLVIEPVWQPTTEGSPMPLPQTLSPPTTR
jgi:hypothetical protein